MDFSHAVKALSCGHRVRRREWLPGLLLRVTPEGFVALSDRALWAPELKDFTAIDWDMLPAEGTT